MLGGVWVLTKALSATVPTPPPRLRDTSGALGLQPAGPYLSHPCLRLEGQVRGWREQSTKQCG